MTTLPVAKEGGVFGIRATFLEKSTSNPEGNEILPNEGLTWSLSDKDGNTINDRLDQPLDSATTVIVVLKGADLSITNNYPALRYFTIKGTYDSLMGNDLPLIDELEFMVVDLKGEG